VEETLSYIKAIKFSVGNENRNENGFRIPDDRTTHDKNQDGDASGNMWVGERVNRSKKKWLIMETLHTLLLGIDIDICPCIHVQHI
jgi:hypothetical protein